MSKINEGYENLITHLLGVMGIFDTYFQSGKLHVDRRWAKEIDDALEAIMDKGKITKKPVVVLETTAEKRVRQLNEQDRSFFRLDEESYEEFDKRKWSHLEEIEKQLDQKLVNVPAKGRNHWWKPPSALMINQTLLGDFNLWQFTILGGPIGRRYVKADPTYNKPEAIILNPTWASFGRDTLITVGGMATHPVDEIVSKLVNVIKSGDPLTEIVEGELKLLENKFQMQIPDSIRQTLVRDVEKIAKRRIGANLVNAKQTVFPFDGSKPFQIGRYL